MPNDPINVLQLLPALISGGVERSTVDIAAALVKSGNRAFVASSGGPMVKELERAGAIHITLPMGSKMPWQIFSNAKAICKIVQEHKIDIVHSRSRAPAWAAHYAKKQLDKNPPSRPVHFMTTFHGTYNLGKGWHGNIKRAYNRVMTEGERIVANSHFIARHIATEYGVPLEKITVIPRGIDMVKFDPTRISDERTMRLLKRWQTPEEMPLILLPGRFTRWKGQLFLLDALAKMKHLDWFCVMIGSDHGHEKYRREVEAHAVALGLAGRVKLLGECDDMPAAYRLADVVVSPSQDPEAFGRIAVEAQAMGRLVVASDHGGSSETIIPLPCKDGTGWLFSPHDVDACAQKITDALQTPDDMRRMIGARATGHVAANFTRIGMCEAKLAVYHSLVNEK
jgi:glycosyltransferase involved in cell wall biosynthesis